MLKIIDHLFNVEIDVNANMSGPGRHSGVSVPAAAALLCSDGGILTLDP